MKLKKLILQGFKSFADKTEFTFEDGINVIVGPNGCGKSNIVDAVKWVLGEQRPSSLRGKEMQDVIFSGTDARKGLGFAEVGLVLDNEQQTLPLDYLEVVITRRLYKSGESEYLINGNRTRLRDIRELLMDSGGGPGAMTVMEQGNIDRLLRADPQERRRVFEEAAGISKYRARRKETQRKLERTTENLARMRDMLAEYETRQRSLKIQAGKARRWREFTEELKKKRVVGALARFSELSRQRDETGSQLEAITSAEAEARAALEQAIESGESRRRALDAIQELAVKAETDVALLIGERRAAEEKEAARIREAAELLERAEAAATAATEARRRADGQRDDCDRARAENDAAAEERRAREDTMSAADALLDEVDGRVALLKKERDSVDRARAEAFRDETGARNEELSAGAELKALRHRLARLEERAAASGEELRALEAQREEFDLSVRKAEEEQRALEDRLTAAERGEREGRREAEAAAAQASAHAGDLAALSARHDLLRGLVADGEGLTKGTRALLESGLPGVAGTIADAIGDAGEQAAALDQALGDLAGAVIVETTDQAVAAIRWLQDGERGRARVLPLDRVARRPLPAPFHGLDVWWLGALLEDTRIVGTLEEALVAGSGVRVIALTGEQCDRSGAIVGGTGGTGAGLVLRNAELAEVGEKRGSIEGAYREAEGRVAGARRKADDWEQTIADLKPRLTAARAAARAAGEGLASARKHASSRADEIDQERAERAELKSEIDELAARLDATRKQLSALETARLGLDADADALQERLGKAAHDRDDAARGHTEAKVELARWAEKSGALASRVAVLEDSIAAATREAEARSDEDRACRERRVACLDEVESLKVLAVEREKGLSALAKTAEEQRSKARAMQQGMDVAGEQARALRTAHDERREELEKWRLRENEIRFRVEALLDSVRRDYGLDLESVDIDEEARAADPQQLESEIADLQSKIERLGNVNHTALEQLAEVEEKITFLRAQEADLLAADKQLRDTIDKIDEVCTTRFSETFEKVRGHFEITFRKLFGGGKAELFLADPDDILNSGIEIRVRPPGKELRNMALLSGGERSLTTVALLFSIYQTKPPPFCLLDEVDAALDESNTIRMCEMLKEFALRGQFIVITHARPTMTVADRLYGVTMPEAGVSRHVSVRFADIEAGRVIGLN